MSRHHSDARAAALARFIDDAALFPPARTPMDRAVPAHAVHRSAPHAWMVGRFLCPASRLGELLEALPSGQRLALSVVCDGAGGGTSFPDAFRADLARAADAQGGAVQVEAIEVRLPGDDPGPAVAEIVEAAEESSLRPGLELFGEVPVAGRAPDTVARAIAALARARKDPPARVAPPVAKVRCGGADAAAFPTPDELAGFIVACRNARVPFKATAGLHHPHRYHDREIGVEQHGFLNLLAASTAAHVSGADADACAQILASPDPGALRLDATALRTPRGAHEASDLARTRRELFIGVGSCAIDEPIEYLAALGVLTEEGALV